MKKHFAFFFLESSIFADECAFGTRNAPFALSFFRRCLISRYPRGVATEVADTRLLLGRAASWGAGAGASAEPARSGKTESTIAKYLLLFLDKWLLGLSVACY